MGNHGSDDPLNLVEEGYLTKTGEYDVQIKGVKEDGSFAWSNMLAEFGTGNINPNEFYSFDNRIFSTPIAKEGVGVSDEKYHGESGYSLRFEAGSGGGQINMVKYEGAMDGVDLRYVRSLSYWVYLDPIAGVTDTTVATSDASRSCMTTAWATIRTASLRRASPIMKTARRFLSGSGRRSLSRAV